MRFERRAQDQSRIAVGALVGGLLVAAAGLAALWLHLGLPRPVCHLRDWTGVPCPTCGSTRMVDALLSGDIVAAVAWNPLAFCALTAIALWAVLSVIRLVCGLPTWRIVLADRERVGVRLLGAVALAAGWAYLFWRGV